MLLGVYEGSEQTPTNLLGITEITKVSPNDGWQSIDLISPVNVADSQKIWLSWVYEDNPGIYYTDGQPGRVESGFPWVNGMPELWGDTAKTANSIYSIYANYLPLDSLYARISGPSLVQVNESFALSSDSSFDMNDGISAYDWNFGDGNQSSLANPSHIFELANTYNVSLTITNVEGHTHTSTKEINVSAPNLLPVAEANGPYSGKVDSIITFSKDGSYDPDGALIAHIWNFGDGTRSQISNPTHTYTEAGVYVVSLTVADQQGKIAVDTALVSVSDFTLSDNLFEATGDEFLIYPNPVSSARIKLSFQNEQNTGKQIRLMNMQGTLLKEYLTKENEYLLNLETLPNGMYLIIIQTTEKMMGSKILLLR
jgi:chitodextrinase